MLGVIRNTLLIAVAQNGNKRMAKLLMRRGCNKDLTNNAGNTALHFAFAYNFEALGNYLIEKGADDGVQNSEHQRRQLSACL